MMIACATWPYNALCNGCHVSYAPSMSSIGHPLRGRESKDNQKCMSHVDSVDVVRMSTALTLNREVVTFSTHMIKMSSAFDSM